MTTRSSLWLILLLAPLSVQAQDYSDLDPSRWFPLEIGNTWLYDTAGSGNLFGPSYVHTAVRDTLVEGRRWTEIRETYCSGPPNCPFRPSRWYHFSADHYLLYGDFAQPDTLLKTTPRSFFSSTAAADSTFQTECVSTRRPGFADVFIREDYEYVYTPHRDAGSEADSTHLSLVLNRDEDGDSFRCSLGFIYNVGWGDNLEAAIIGGRGWGDVEALNRLIALAAETEDEAVSDEVALSVYPNPARGHITVDLRGSQYQDLRLCVYNTLGQRVFCSTEKPVHQRTVFRLAEAGLTRSGVYLLRVMAGARLLKTTIITVVQ